jgi:hypothetical protein
MASAYAQKIIDVLTPSIGDFVAKAKVNAACKLANVDAEALEKSSSAEMIKKLEATLVATLGQAGTDALIKKIKDL